MSFFEREWRRLPILFDNGGAPMSYRIRGGDRLMRVLKTLPREMTTEVRQTIKTSAESLAAEVRARAPEDTGALKSAIRARISQKGLRARVGIFGMKNTRIAGAAAGLMQKHGMKKGKAARLASALGAAPLWARWIEFGTVKMAARPYLFPTFREKRRAILGGITAAAKKAIAGVK